MIQLYFGYLLVHLYSVIGMFFKATMTIETIIFSIIVFLIWSFVPVLGYFIAKVAGAKGEMNLWMLFFSGALVSLLENILFYFNVLSIEQNSTGTLFAFVLFFIIAFISIKSKKLVKTSRF